MDSVYHVSEDPGIERFEPRLPPAPSAAITVPVVWAVAQTHLANYLLPRECPREPPQWRHRGGASTAPWRDC